MEITKVTLEGPSLKSASKIPEFVAPKDTVWEYPAASQFWTEKQDRIRKVFTASSQGNSDWFALKNELAVLQIVPGVSLIDLIKELNPIKKTKTDDWVVDSQLTSANSIGNQWLTSANSIGIRSKSDLARLIQIYLALKGVWVSKENTTPTFDSIDGVLGKFTEKSIAIFQMKDAAWENHMKLNKKIWDLRSAPFQNWIKSNFDEFLTQNVRAGKGVETVLTQTATVNFLKNGTVEMKMYDLTIIYNPSNSSLDVMLPNKEKVSFPVSFPLTINKDDGGVLIMGNHGNTANIQKMFQYAALFGFAHSNYISTSAPHAAEKFVITKIGSGISVDTKKKVLDTTLISGLSLDKMMIDEAARLKGTKLKVQALNPLYANQRNILGESYKNSEDARDDLNILKDMMPEDIVNFLNRMLELSKPKQENERVLEKNRRI